MLPRYIKQSRVWWNVQTEKIDHNRHELNCILPRFQYGSLGLAWIPISMELCRTRLISNFHHLFLLVPCTGIQESFTRKLRGSLFFTMLSWKTHCGLIMYVSDPQYLFSHMRYLQKTYRCDNVKVVTKDLELSCANVCDIYSALLKAPSITIL